MVRAQKELPDSLALVLIVLVVIGTLSYFVFNHWQRVKDIENMAQQVNAEQVAAKMSKEREDLRAVMNGEKRLEDVDAETLASNPSHTDDIKEDIKKVTYSAQARDTVTQEPKAETVAEAVKEKAKPEKKPAADQVKAKSGSDNVMAHEQSGVLAEGINQYSCSQKQQCSQMKSCAEAKFYAKQCSNTKIKPDENGKVCPELCG